LPDDWVQCVNFDPRGRLWLGTHRGGVAHIVDSGVESTTRASGLGDPSVSQLVESLDGRMWAWTELGGTYEITSRGAALAPGSDVAPFSNVRMRVLQDRRGVWWIGTDLGLYRIDGPELDFARARACAEEWGLPAGNVFGEIGEDRDGAIWVAMISAGLFRLDAADAARETGRFQPVELARDGSPPRAAWFDARGVFWTATNERVWRRGADGWQSIVPGPVRDGELRPRGLDVDRRGWLWIGTRFDGLFLARDPSAATPVFERWTTAQGLASDAVYGVADDERGRMYVATTKGLDRIDPESREVEHWTTSDGLAGALVNQVLIDREAACGPRLPAERRDSIPRAPRARVVRRRRT
jgi:ligand-binding sensor domain-containing protein